MRRKIRAAETLIALAVLTSTACITDGKASLEDIAHRLTTEFPERFARWEEALSYAGIISQEYSR